MTERDDNLVFALSVITVLASAAAGVLMVLEVLAR